MRDQRFDLAAILKFVDIATSALSDAREEIDALNVYPVPDGDTGTNMFLTISSAREALLEATGGGDPTTDLEPSMVALSRGALLGARGNSGVILSQMLRAVASCIARVDPNDRYAAVFADSLHQATEASYDAVGTPVEGTILTVSRAASQAALAEVADPEAHTSDVLSSAADAAREALARTPTQLQALADAGVVDAGGRGLCVILDAAETALTGRRPVTPPRRTLPVPIVVPSDDLQADGPSYEVMYLLDAEAEQVAILKKTLAGLGDSLVVVGGEGLWNVHVHVDDVGAAIEAGIVAGRPHRVQVTHFAEQIAEVTRRPSTRSGRRVIAVAAGEGLARIFEEAGALVVPGGAGNRPSTGMLLEAIESSGAAEIIVLPNDPDSIRVAEIAAHTAEESGEVRVAVIESQAQVQGLSAVAVHEPGRSFDQDVLHMTATARHARHGAVTVAVRQAITMAGPCEPGDVLGVIEGDFAAVGADLYDVSTGIIDRLVGGGGELITLVAGQDGQELATLCGQYVESTYPIVDVVVYEGGQERYPLLIAVE